MKYDMGLSLGADRVYDRRFRAVRNYFVLDKLRPEHVLELRVLLATPGFKLDHFRAMFGWSFRSERQAHWLAQQASEDVVGGYVAQNLASVSVADGLTYLSIILENRPHWSGTVPWWTSLALAELRRQGADRRQLAERFGTTVPRIGRWWREERRFDPVSGRSY